MRAQQAQAGSHALAAQQISPGCTSPTLAPGLLLQVTRGVRPIASLQHASLVTGKALVERRVGPVDWPGRCAPRPAPSVSG